MIVINTIERIFYNFSMYVNANGVRGKTNIANVWLNIAKDRGAMDPNNPAIAYLQLDMATTKTSLVGYDKYNSYKYTNLASQGVSIAGNEYFADFAASVQCTDQFNGGLGAFPNQQITIRNTWTTYANKYNAQEWTNTPRTWKNTPIWSNTPKTWSNTPVWTNTPKTWSNTPKTWSNVPEWSNTPIWNNYWANSSTRCYTSIQIGSWWYMNGKAVTTSGNRAYHGDGGNSGRPGNAGFVLIVPQSA